MVPVDCAFVALFHLRVVGLALRRFVPLLLLVACSPEVVRPVVVDPATAARLQPDSVVIGRGDVRVPRATIVREGDGYVFVSGSYRAHLAPDERVVIEKRYHEGDLVPGEGRVRTRTHPALTWIGVVLLLVGPAVFAASVVELASYHAPPCQSLCTVDAVPVLAGLGVLFGGAVSVGGIGLFIAAWVPSAYIEPGRLGGTITLSF